VGIFVIYRKRLIDGIFAAASCCLYPFFLTVRTVKVGCRKMVLDAVNLDVENFLAWSLFILLIIIMVEV
jgi:hypothetical protein